MNLLYVLFTYNRPSILQESIRTLLENQTVKPNRWLIIDDGSHTEMKNGLYNFHIQNRGKIPIDYFSFSDNAGLGYQWELALNYIKSRNDFDYIGWLEGDYVWRKSGVDEALAVLEAKPLTVACSGYSNPDFYNGKQETLFREVMLSEFGSDPAKREFLHKPQKLNTGLGEIEIQFTTNSCGCSFWNWNRIKQLIDKYPEVWERCFLRSCNVPHPDRRRYAGDGPLTAGTSFYWYKDIEDRILKGEKIDYNNEGPWVDIADTSISNHINGGRDSLNGHIIEEGQTFVSSPKWPFRSREEYNSFVRQSK